MSIPTPSLRAEIEAWFGGLPLFWALALERPSVAAAMWSAGALYRDSPLPPPLRERIMARLSRYCPASYCMVAHSVMLRQIGAPDEALIALLEEAAPASEEDLSGELALLAVTLEGWPVPESAEARALLRVLEYCFLWPRRSGPAREALRRAAGPERYSALVALVSFARLAHTWALFHDELCPASDPWLAPMADELTATPGLGALVSGYDQRVAAESKDRERQLQEEIDRYRILQAKLQVDQRMAMVGQLASGVAHDLNSLLTVLFASSVELMHTTGEREQVAEEATALHQAVQSAAGLTDELLRLSRQRPRPEEVLAVGEFLEGLEPVLRRVVGRQVRLVMRAPGRPLQISVARVHLEQILLNLAVNARQAMPSGGTLSVRARAIEWAELPGCEGEVRALEISVSDTGEGIPRELHKRIFETFYSTRGGTGLGLATVRALVEQLGGQISLESTPGRGTRFMIHLPLAAERAAA